MFLMGGEIMKKLNRICVIFLAGSLLGVILCMPVMVYSQETDYKNRIPEGIYMELTKDFYKALRDEASSGTKTYTNDPSKKYLKQIAISTRFMVETNLQILRQQEKMIRLLDSLLEDRKK